MDNDLKVLDLYKKTSPNKINSFNNSIQSSYTVESNFEKFEANFEWLELMEDTVRYLDNILRNPNRFIVNEEEVVNVEKARRITVESIKHLSKHTNYIQEIEANGDVKPSKILNINKDESYNTYENRVIYTLINNMRMFVDMRKRDLVTSSYVKDAKKAEYHGVTRVGAENVDINLVMSSKASTTEKYTGKNDDTIEERIEKLEMRITDLCNTPVYKTLAKEHVARVIPPIKKTNLILKNVNFQYAMNLWNFLQAYEEGQNKAIKDKVKYEGNAEVKQMFDDVFMLNYLVVNSLNDTSKVINKDEDTKEMIEKLTDNMITKIVELNADLPVCELEKIIGDKIAVIRNKKEASLAEIEAIFNKNIQSVISKIINFSFRS